MPSIDKPATALIPEKRTLGAVKTAAAGCRACPLWQSGTQTVFGEGKPGSRVMLVGEQPGDVEDRAGRPFVGPAGRVLDQALNEAGIARGDVYITNVVKHFKWVPKGRLRLHQKPNAREIGACLPWLEAEIELIRPLVFIALGATAAQAVLGKQVRVTTQRGRFLSSPRFAYAMATIHPSAILRSTNKEDRQRGLEGLIHDLQLAAEKLNET